MAKIYEERAAGHRRKAEAAADAAAEAAAGHSNEADRPA